MEIEAKYKCDNLEEFSQKVLDKGFVLEKSKHQIDTYFIVNRKNDDGTRDYLRIRGDPEGNNFSLDFHKVLSLLETDETETKFNDMKGMVKILSALGFEVVCVLNKDRKKYKKDSLIVVLDKVEGLGDFVEVEFVGESTDENKDLVLKTASELGLKEKNRVIKKGYPDLLIESLK
ncbi:MAG: class IV adenylate cyclase [archaeon]